jgi:hypothetical protein
MASLINRRLITNIFVLVSCCIFCSCANNIPREQSIECDTIPGMENIIAPGKIILLGEIHGTQEGPQYVAQVVCHALRKDLNVTVGLELPQSDQSVINAYLNSKGNESAIASVLSLSFWGREYQDGRASQAMFELIEYLRKLKETQANIDLLLIDNPASDDRDIAMAKTIISRAKENKNDFMIILTGNYHNMIYDGSGQMGSYVLSAFDTNRVVSLLQRYSGGSAWLDIGEEGIGPIGLIGDGLNEVSITLDDSLGEYQGYFDMDSIHYSRPAKEMINK